MKGARMVGLVVFLFVASFARTASAHEGGTDDEPSIFSYAYQGLFAGAAVGGGGGYLVGRRDGWKKSDWRAVGLGLSIGALAGAGLGLTLGLLGRGEVHTPRYMARDFAAGTGFGIVIGLLSGGISAAVQHEAEHVLFGAAIGAIAGAGVGLIVGAIEGATHKQKAASAPTTRRLTPTFALVPSGASASITAGIAARL